MPITRLSQVVALSDFYKKWNGYNSYSVITSNKELKLLKEKNKDSKINSKVLKQLSIYDLPALKKVLAIGITVHYQKELITFKSIKKGSVAITLEQVNTPLNHTSTLTKGHLQAFVVNNEVVLNHDSIDVLQAIYDYIQGVL